MRLTNYEKQAFVRAVMDDTPAVDYTTQATKLAQDFAVSKMHKDLRKVYDNASLRGFLDVTWHQQTRQHLIAPVDLPPEVKAEYDTLISYAKDQIKRRDELEWSLRSAIASMTTRKQLVEAFPEFEKYAPVEVGKSQNLPTLTNVVKEFVAAGWPKDVAKGKKK